MVAGAVVVFGVLGAISLVVTPGRLGAARIAVSAIAVSAIAVAGIAIAGTSARIAIAISGSGVIRATIARPRLEVAFRFGTAPGQGHGAQQGGK